MMSSNGNGRHDEIDVSRPPKLVRATSASTDERPFTSPGSVIVNGNSDSLVGCVQNGVISTAATQTEEGELSSHYGHVTRDPQFSKASGLNATVASLCSRVDHLEEKLTFVNRELHLVRDLLQCLTRLVPAARELKLDGKIPEKADHLRYAPEVVSPREYQPSNHFRRDSNQYRRTVSPDVGRTKHRDISNHDTNINRGVSPPLDRPELIRIPRGAHIGDTIPFQMKTTVMMPTSSSSVQESHGYRNGTIGSRKGLLPGEEDGSYERHRHLSDATAEKDFRPREFENKEHGRRALSETDSYDPLQCLPSNMSALDAIFLWEHGTRDVPPIRLWNTSLSSGSRSRLLAWQKLVQIFNNECNGDVKRFVAENSGRGGELLSISEILSKYDEEQYHTDDESIKSSVGESSFREDIKHERKIPNHESKTSPSTQQASSYFILPRKINGKKISALDVIHIWENGFGDIPPIKKWTPAQKLKQQSKISRWKKIIDILNIECGGDIRKFESQYSTNNGSLMPVAAVIAKYEAAQAARDEYGISTKLNYAAKASLPTMTPHQNSYPVSSPIAEVKNEKSANEKYAGVITGTDDNLEPRAKRCCVEVPYSTARERSYSSDCFSPSESNVFPNTPYIRHSSMSNKGEAGNSSHSSPSNSKDALGNGSDIIVTSSYTITDGDKFDRSGLDDRKDFVLPTQVDAIDVIQLWEHGSDSFPAIKLWSPCQKLAQRSKISRWNKIVDIYRFECSGDLSLFKERYSNSKGELLPITSIIAKYCSEKEAQSPDCLFIPDAEPLVDVCTVGITNDSSSPSSSSYFPCENSRVHFLKTDDPPLHVLPRKINGRKVSAKDVIQIWNHGLNNIPPVVSWSPQQKVKQQSKISRWKKVVDIYQHDCHGDMDVFESKYSNKLGELLPIAAIIAKNEAERGDQGGDDGNKIEM